MYDELRQEVCRANVEMYRQGLVVGTFGNLSGIDRVAGVMAIKPSGVEYEKLTPEKIVVTDLEGNVLEGDLRPSTETMSHLELYRSFKFVGSVCHTHSPNATVWCQAVKAIPCFGTTHAGYFHGAVPVTDVMSEEEIKTDYELNTGKVIVRCFEKIDPAEVPGVLVAGHGPFVWGPNCAAAVETAMVLEQVAMMAIGTLAINPGAKVISKALLDKYYLRKFGKDSYYGQK